MDKGRYTLLVAEVETVIVLDSRGKRCSGAVPFQPAFDTREAAMALKDELLRTFPFAEVSLTDTAGEHETELFTDEAAFVGYAATMATWRKWAYGSWLRRLFKTEPPNPRET
ncbi:MAG: hypothetical protein Q8S73_06220 [Deltaproteobacteria bacterium]|nr:hypothetical protein [Myxococcales bacterium]MDP3213679.1 hypothetical protein [Deltaproteobacteria bacterium]